MKRTKTQKGITLIALIITIVVLLILAAVAISSIQNDGILHYAQNAADSWNSAQANESQMLQEYLGYLNGLTAPTKIEGVSISGKTFTAKAIGGSANTGMVGYQYSVDGSTWSDTVASGTNYTFENLFASGTNWTVYARTVDSAGGVSNNAELKIISFNFSGTTYYAKAGTKWGAFIEDSFAGQLHEFSGSYDVEEGNSGSVVWSTEDDWGFVYTDDEIIKERYYWCSGS